MTVPNANNIFGLDTSDHATDGFKGMSADVSMQAKASTAGSIDDEDQSKLEYEGGSKLAGKLLRLSQVAYSQGTLFHQTAVRPAWVRSYKAFHNKHFETSKYLSKEYLSRSKLFRPKTRSAIRRKMVQAAQALFSTGDIVAVTAQNEADPFQVASAAVKQELVNYRLSRNTARNGIRWFLICMGALQDANITGLVVSKQTWRFKERKFKKAVQTQDPMTGLPFMIMQEASEIIEDRPDIELFAPENVVFDPNADWTDPAQTAQYICLRRPMSPDDALDFMNQNRQNERAPFFDIDRATLMTKVDSSGPTDAVGVRATRQQGRDPIMMTSGDFGRVWLHEWFLRYDGEDWCFWTIGETLMASDPIPVRQAYPEQGGARPVVIGYGALEAHRPYPMSPVESWQPLQQEANDQVNLRLDHMKQVVSPPMKVVRGKKVDATQVQRRGPNSVVYVGDQTDVEPFQMPDVPQSAYVENNYVNQDFDELAGAFNPMGTEQSNKGASETLGGMSLLANAATSTGEFDLTVFVETWVSPVLTQILKLEEMYESDATVLEICGDRAKLFDKFGIDVVTDRMLLSETTVAVKAGVGASSHPMERLQKLQMAFGALMGFFTPFVQTGKMQMPQPRAKAIADYVFGAVGIPEGAETFFSNVDQLDQPMPPQPPPPDPKAQTAHEKNQIDAQKAQMKFQTDQASIAQKREQVQINAADAAAQRRADILKEHMRSMAEIRRAEAQGRAAHYTQRADHAHDVGMANMNVFHDLLRAGHAASLQPKNEGQTKQ